MARNKVKAKPASLTTAKTRQKSGRKSSKQLLEVEESVPVSPLASTNEESVPEVAESQDEETEHDTDLQKQMADTSASQENIGEKVALEIGIEVDEAGVWTPEREDKLIDLFEACVFLYDKTAPGFQQRHKKDMAMRKFAGILGVTGMYAIFAVGPIITL